MRPGALPSAVAMFSLAYNTKRCGSPFAGTVALPWAESRIQRSIDRPSAD